MVIYLTYLFDVWKNHTQLANLSFDEIVDLMIAEVTFKVSKNLGRGRQTHRMSDSSCSICTGSPSSSRRTSSWLAASTRNCAADVALTRTINCS